jgi:transcription-repair coupling factor (superfamily II helicase)
METLQEYLQDSLSGSLSAFANAGKESLHLCGATIPMASMMVA